MSDPIPTMRAFLTAKASAEAQRDEAARTRALAALPALTELLVTTFGATEVYLFGSLVWGPPRADADIDLAVRGLAAVRYFEALGELLVVAPVSVDLVSLEDAPAGLVERIERHGRRLA